MSNKDNNHIVDVNKKISSVDWLAEKFNHVNWLRNRDEISAGMADEWRKHYLEQAKAMHKEEHINTYQHGIKAGIGVAIDIEKGNDFSDLTPDEFYQQTYGEN